MKTLVVIGSSLRINEELILHGAELRPGALSQDEITQLLDSGRLEESDRRSYYALFPEFSGSGLEPTPFDDELARYSLPDVE